MLLPLQRVLDPADTISHLTPEHAGLTGSDPSISSPKSHEVSQP